MRFWNSCISQWQPATIRFVPRNRKTRQDRDSLGRWKQGARSRSEVPAAPHLSMDGPRSLGGLRDHAADLGIDTKDLNDLDVVRLLAEHEVRQDVDGVDEARSDPSLAPDMRPEAAIAALIRGGHSPRAAVAAALTTCFA